MTKKLFSILLFSSGIALGQGRPVANNDTASDEESTPVDYRAVNFERGYRFNNNFDLALAFQSNQFLGAASWVHFQNITRNRSFKIGYGVRFNSQFGKNLNYATAPAELTSGRTDPGVFFSEILDENIDTLYVSKVQNNSLNVSVNLQYTFRKRLDLGFNIDVLGFSFGKSTTGIYKAYQSADNGSVQTASPTPFNLLLVSDNDIGMLNSELYLRYWLNSKWAVKAGASFAFTEYTTNNKLRLDNDRWRNKSLMAMVAVTYSPFSYTK